MSGGTGGGGCRIPRARRLLRYSYETGTTEMVMDELFYAPHPRPSGAGVIFSPVESPLPPWH